MEQAGDGVRQQNIETIHLLVVVVIEVDLRGDAMAVRVKLKPEVWCEAAGVGTDDEEVAGGFHRGEAGAADFDGGGSGEGLDGGTHGGFELIDCWAVFIAGVGCFAVPDHWQWDKAAVFNEGFLEVVEPDPQIVGIEKAVAPDVLEGLGIGVRALGAFAEDQTFRAWDPRGAWYAANGSVFLAADPTRVEGNMGTELDLSFTVPILEKNLALAGNVSVFLPGGEAPGRAPSTWGFLSVRSQF